MTRLATILAVLSLLTAGPELAAGDTGLVPEAVAEYGSSGAARILLVRGTTDIDAFAPVLMAFARNERNLRIRYEQWASNDLFATAQAACDGVGPSADMVISSAVDLQVKLVNDGCAQPHQSAWTALLPQASNWRNELFGVTREPAVMVYNRLLVPPAEAPRSRFDLLDLLRPDNSRYAGRVATYDIEQSGLGYLFAFADSGQATTFGSLIEAFGRSRAVATCCSAEIIDGVATGKYLIAYNVLGSYALARAAADPRIAVAAPEDYTLVLTRGALIPRNARNVDDAAAFLDFMLSDSGRDALAQTRLLVSVDYPDDVDAELQGVAESALRPIALSPALLVGLDQQKHAQFIARWRAAFPAANRPTQ